MYPYGLICIMMVVATARKPQAPTPMLALPLDSIKGENCVKFADML